MSEEKAGWVGNAYPVWSLRRRLGRQRRSTKQQYNAKVSFSSSIAAVTSNVRGMVKDLH